MRISDWSSDVCSSDLSPNCGRTCEPAFLRHKRHWPAADVGSKRSVFPESLLSHLPPRGSRRQGYSEWRRNQPSLAAPICPELALFAGRTCYYHDQEMQCGNGYHIHEIGRAHG